MACEPSAARTVSSKAARTVSSAASISSALRCKRRGAVDDRLDADFGRRLDLARQVGQIVAARGLPRAVEIVMHQLAALAFADDFGKPVGGGHQARDFAAAWRQRRRGIKLGIGQWHRWYRQLAPKDARCRARSPGPARPAKLDRETADRKSRHRSRWPGRGTASAIAVDDWTANNAPASGSKHGRSQPFGDRELPHALPHGPQSHMADGRNGRGRPPRDGPAGRVVAACWLTDRFKFVNHGLRQPGMKKAFPGCNWASGWAAGHPGQAYSADQFGH